jgi:hypothetical protein
MTLLSAKNKRRTKIAQIFPASPDVEGFQISV